MQEKIEVLCKIMVVTEEACSNNNLVVNRLVSNINITGKDWSTMQNYGSYRRSMQDRKDY